VWVWGIVHLRQYTHKYTYIFTHKIFICVRGEGGSCDERASSWTDVSGIAIILRNKNVVTSHCHPHKRRNMVEFEPPNTCPKGPPGASVTVTLQKDKRRMDYFAVTQIYVGS